MFFSELEINTLIYEIFHFFIDLKPSFLHRTHVKYHRPCTGQQGDAPLGHRLQPEKVPEIRTKRFEKRSGTACFDGIGQKCAPKPFSNFHDASEFGLPFLSRQEKSPVKGLISTCSMVGQGLVQRLPLLGVVFLFK